MHLIVTEYLPSIVPLFFTYLAIGYLIAGAILASIEDQKLGALPADREARRERYERFMMNALTWPRSFWN